MSIQGSELTLYTTNELLPIACGVTTVLTITGEEIIRTTKGSGRATNRMIGSYDWQVQDTGVIMASVASGSQVHPYKAGSNVLTGKKIAVKVTIGNEFYFGLGVVTQATYTGTEGNLAEYDVLIKADGPLYETSGLKNDETEPELLSYSTSTFSITYSDARLFNAEIMQVYVDGLYYAPDTYTFNPDNGGGLGVITFDTAFATGKTVVIFYFVP